ncbi:hypothetical protein [Streptomyces sioyaensis]|uniref:hypothetical protein n=1 Tax=Streptomyces sioyaensis TaxID=67364 RepID=UPI003715DAF4
MSAHAVQAACYGIGAIYPVVILDEVHRWARPTHPGLPERQSGTGHGMLVLRWTGPQGEHTAAPGLLAAAAARAPAMPVTGDELLAYQQSLPHGLYLTTLSAELVLGPWEQRPGAASAPGCLHRSA